MMIAIAAAPVILAAIFFFDVVYRQQQTLQDHAIARAEGLAMALAANSRGRFFALETIPKTLEGYPGLEHAAIISPRGMFIAHSTPEQVTEYVDDTIRGRLTTEQAQAGIVLQDDDVIHVYEPIMSAGNTVGWAMVTLSKQELASGRMESIRRAGVYASIVIGLGLLYGFYATGRLNRRLRHMVDVANALRAGESTARVGDLRRDEYGRVGQAIDALADIVDRRETELRIHKDQLEKTVRKRTEDLEDEIAERKIAEEELSRSEGQIRQIVNSAGDAIVALDEHGQIVIFNNAAQKMFGYSAMEAIGQNVKILMPEAAALNHDANVARFAEEQTSYILGDKRRIFATRKSGEEFPVEVAVSTLYLGEQRLFTAIVRDVSERTEAEDALKETLRQLNASKNELQASEHRLRILLDKSPAGISVKRAGSGERLYANDRFLDMFGIRKSEELDEYGVPNSFVKRQDWMTIAEHIRRGQPVEGFITERTRVNGEKWWVQLDVIPLEFEGIPSVVIWHHDMSERIAAEETQKDMLRRLNESTKELQKSETRLQRLFDNSPSGVVAVRRRDGKRLYANPRLLELFAVESLEELNNFGFIDTYVSQDDWDVARQFIRSGSSYKRFVMERKRVNGEHWWAMLEAVPMTFMGEEAVVVWHNDITDQKQTERDLANTLDELNQSRSELENSEKRLRDILDSSPAGIAVVNKNTGKRLYVNEHLLNMFGATNLEELERFQLANTFASEAEFRKARRYLQGIGHLGTRAVLERLALDGRKWWALTDYVPINYMGEESVIVWHHDITQQRNADAELSGLLESSPVGVSIFGQEFGDRIYMNKRYLELFNAETPEQLQAFGLKNTFVSEKDFDLALAHFESGHSVQSIVMERRKIDGERWWAKGYALPIEFRGKPTFIIWLADITDQKKAEAELVQSEKLASLGGLVAGVAHEVNTPIGISVTAISHLHERCNMLNRQFEQSEMTRSDLVSFLETADQSCGMISSNLKRAADLVRSFKQVAVDQYSDGVRKFLLHEYLEEVMRSLAPQLKKSSRISVDIQGDKNIELQSYPGPIAQIMTNLVMNSIIHGFPDMEAGEIAITLEPDGDDVHIIYADNGKGIAPENVTKVFDPFFTTNRSAGGSGLGMHIAYNLITQKLCGSVEIDSKPGEGVRFDICVPLSLGGSK